MTLEKLIQIIVEVVERHFFLERQKVLALCFDEANRQELMDAANSINGNADCFSSADLDRIHGDYDVMFVDYIPVFAVAEAALGICVSSWGRLMASMFSRSKPVFQLKKAPGSDGISQPCRKLLKEHWARLDSLGVILLDTLDTNEESFRGEEQEPIGEKVVYTKNLLSRRDVCAFNGINTLVVGKGVLVTALAEDMAKDLKIKLVRQ